jgi:hypothetical protein
MLYSATHAQDALKLRDYAGKWVLLMSALRMQ